MEIHGGGGYVEDGTMARLFRQSPLNSIWEGSGNVICLDVLRVMTREPDCVAAFIDELDLARGENIALDRAIDDVKTCLRPSRINEAAMRHVVEVMALALQGSILVRHAPSAVADAFCAINLGDHPGFAYGATEANIDTDAILARANPQI